MPLTYRGAPLDSAEQSLITTMTHTTLGVRWVYDACHDPVYVTALVTTILRGVREADLFMSTDAGLVQEVNTVHVQGSGSSPTVDRLDLSTPEVSHDQSTTRIDAGLAVTLLRVPTAAGAGALTLTGTWPSQETPLLLATIDGRP